MDKGENLSAGEGYFFRFLEPRFGIYDVRDEELHREIWKEKPGYELTETQYYGFYVPEVRLHCYTWVWYHPNLNTLTAGTMAWTGIQKYAIASELYDFRTYMSGDIFRDGFMQFTTDNGLSVHAVEPGKVIRLRYEDPASGNAFDVTQAAVGEPLMWPTSHHFEQVMRCEGTIRLAGRQFPVDCLSVRDRSFNEYRSEAPVGIPPNSWVTAVFDESFSFCVVGMDDPALGPLWSGEPPVSKESLLRFGWMVIEGRKRAVSSISMKIDYARDTLLPRAIRVALVDSEGQTHEAVGTILAATPFHPWLNARCPICLVEWSSGGKTGFGEIQSLQYGKFIRAAE